MGFFLLWESTLGPSRQFPSQRQRRQPQPKLLRGGARMTLPEANEEKGIDGAGHALDELQLPPGRHLPQQSELYSLGVRMSVG
jgi:hypothetical protein